MRDTLWFTPLDAVNRSLQSAYTADAMTEIVTASLFTVRLEGVRLAHAPRQKLLQRLLHPNPDILIVSASALGNKPLVERIHFYKQNLDLDHVLLIRDMLDDTICICDDYDDQDALYIDLKIVLIDTSDQRAEATLNAFKSMASTAGSVFPIALPYVALGGQLLGSLVKLWGDLDQRETWRIIESIKLLPPKTPEAKTIRIGRYIVFSEEVDGSKYQMGGGCEIQGEGLDDISYAIIRIDPADEIEMNNVISQRATTLLTQLKNDLDGQPVGLSQTSFGFLTDTLAGWTIFTDLQRYQELLKKDNRSPAEDSQMQKLKQRPELQPFLPQQ